VFVGKEFINLSLKFGVLIVSDIESGFFAKCCATATFLLDEKSLVK